MPQSPPQLAVQNRWHFLFRGIDRRWRGDYSSLQWFYLTLPVYRAGAEHVSGTDLNWSCQGRWYAFDSDRLLWRCFPYKNEKNSKSFRKVENVRSLWMHWSLSNVDAWQAMRFHVPLPFHGLLWYWVLRRNCNAIKTNAFDKMINVIPFNCWSSKDFCKIYLKMNTVKSKVGWVHKNMPSQPQIV